MLKSLVLLLALALPCVAQLPDAPKPSRIPVTTWVALGTDTTLRLIDANQTETAKSNPCFVEENLSPGIYKHPGAMYGYSLAIPVSYGLGIWWFTRNHPKVAKYLVIAPAADATYELHTVISNSKVVLCK